MCRLINAYLEDKHAWNRIFSRIVLALSSNWNIWNIQSVAAPSTPHLIAKKKKKKMNRTRRSRDQGGRETRRPLVTRDPQKRRLKRAPASRFRGVPSASRVPWRPRGSEPNLSTSPIPSFAGRVATRDRRRIMTRREVDAWQYHATRSTATPAVVQPVNPPRSVALTARSILLFAQLRPIPVRGPAVFPPCRRSPFPAGCLTGRSKDVPNWIKISVQRSESGT